MNLYTRIDGRLVMWRTSIPDHAEAIYELRDSLDPLHPTPILILFTNANHQAVQASTDLSKA